jgi:3'-phosphoadenosine 5'-phosphosulfate sulfotransferase (PAPS reductase)/FAD synthetase
MKKLAVVLVVLSLLAAQSAAFAKPKGVKGASEKAYEHASEEAVFHRVGDWFATIGKSEEEKEKIIAERKAKRAAKRAEQEAKKAQKELEKKKKEMKEKFSGK